MYETLHHYIDGKWVKPSGKSLEVFNPANSKVIGELGCASKGDLDKAVAAAEKGFKEWRKVSAFERGKILRKIGDLVRARADEIAKVLTMEQGKVLAEAKVEVLMGADIFDWFVNAFFNTVKSTIGKMAREQRRSVLDIMDMQDELAAQCIANASELAQAGIRIAKSPAHIGEAMVEAMGAR